MASDIRLGRIERRLWLVSGVVTAAMLILLVQLWFAKSAQEVEPIQMFDEEVVAAYLSDPGNWETRGQEDAKCIRTGVFIQSLQFVSATDVHMTGYVWQQTTEWIGHDREDIHVGFILPELVDSSVVRLEYRVPQKASPAASGVTPPCEIEGGHSGEAEADGSGGSASDDCVGAAVNDDGVVEPAGCLEVIGWYFEGTVRQPFQYRDYPFDHKQVWLRIWPREFNSNTVLIPDFGAYPGGTKVSDEFGVADPIELGVWVRENTYFDYRPPEEGEYNTNFGITNYVGQDKFPELRYNMLIQRRLQSAFIVNLIPLFVVAMLAFAALMTTTHDQERISMFGFSTAGAIGTLSALFFVVLLAHIQLREQIPGSGVVYLEWFYFTMYVVLLGVAVNTYLVSAPWSADNWVIAYKDNLIPKVTYWPMLIGAMAVITIFSF